MIPPAPPLNVQPAGDASRSPAGALSPAHPRLRAAARLGYVLIVLLATLPGTGWSAEPVLVRMRLYRALHPTLTSVDVVDGIRNVALFAGLGIVWILTTRTRRLWPPVWRATAAGTLLSLLVETAQLTSPTRYASVLDVLTNGSGAFVGALAAAMAIRFARWELEQGDTGTTPLLVAAAYLGACTLEAFSPWGHVSPAPYAGGGLGHRLAASIAWLRAAPLADPSLLDVLLFAPAGALLAAAFVESGRRPGRAAAGASLLCAAAFALAEVTRGASGGDMRPLALAAHALAAAVGASACAAALARRARATSGPVPTVPTAVRTPLPLAAAALLVLVLWYWRPFLPRLDFHGVVGRANLVPLSSLRQIFGIYGVVDVGLDALLYFPVGAWLAVRPLRRDGPLGGIVPAIAAATVLELGQLAVRGRMFDVTDLLVEWSGVLVGVAVVAQARLRVLRDRRDRRDRRGRAARGTVVDRRQSAVG